MAALRCPQARRRGWRALGRRVDDERMDHKAVRRACWRCSRASSRGDSSSSTPGSSRTTSSDSCAAATSSALHDGVFVNHTGTLDVAPARLGRRTLGWPAALSHDSALRAADGPGRSGRDDSHDPPRRRPRPAIARGARRLPPAPARAAGRQGAVEHQPARVRIEEALIDVAARKPDDFDAIAVAGRRDLSAAVRPPVASASTWRRAPACRGARSSATCSRDLDARHVLGARARLPRPASSGRTACPPAARQVRDSRHGPLYRDVVYVDLDQVVELDGRLWHDSVESHDADLDRDLDAAVGRLGPSGWGGARCSRGRVAPPYASGAC